MRIPTLLLLSFLPALSSEITLTPKEGDGKPVTVETSRRSEVRLDGKTYVVEPAEESATLAKAREIILPVVDFEDISIEEAAEFLRMRSMELDGTKEGINFVTKGDHPVRIPRLMLRKTSLHEILGFIAELTGAKVEYRNAAIVISAN